MYDSDLKEPTFNTSQDKKAAVPPTVGKSKGNIPEYSSGPAKKNDTNKNLDMGELYFDDDLDAKPSNPKIPEKSDAGNKKSPDFFAPKKPTDSKLDLLGKQTADKPKMDLKPAEKTNKPAVSNSKVNDDPFGDDSDPEMDVKPAPKPAASQLKDPVKIPSKLDLPKPVITPAKPPIAKPPVDSKQDIKKKDDDDDWGMDDKDSNDF